MLHDKHFFRASDLTPFSFKKLNHKHKKPTELSLIYQNRPRGPPTAGCKNLEFGANLDPREQHWISRRIFMIRPEKEISSSTNQEASSSSQEASSSSTVPVETAPPPHASSSSAVPAVAPPLPPIPRGDRNSPPRITDSWRCPNHSCQGWWGETDVQGEYWMLDKENIFGTLPQAENF